MRPTKATQRNMKTRSQTVKSNAQEPFTTLYKESTASQAPHGSNSQLAQSQEIDGLLEALKSLLECSICRERYIDPKMLPCQHAFCSPCLTKMERRLQEGCPICRKSFPPGSLRSCLLLNNLMELASKHSCLAVPREPPSPIPTVPASYDLSELLSQQTDDNSEDDDYEDEDFEDSSFFEFYVNGEPIAENLTSRRFMSSDYADTIIDHLALSLGNHLRNQQQSVRSRRNITNHTQSATANSTQNRSRNAASAVSQLAGGSSSGIYHANGYNIGRNHLRTGRESRRFRRCPNWPQCHLAEFCNFQHPRQKCRNRAPCRYGEACCFLHPEDIHLLSSLGL